MPSWRGSKTHCRLFNRAPSRLWTNSHWPSKGWVGRDSRRPEAQLDDGSSD